MNLTLSIVLVQRIGAVGVIAGTILSYLLVLVVPQSLMPINVLRGPCPDLFNTTQPAATSSQLPAIGSL
jgi:hypothetical protein